MRLAPSELENLTPYQVNLMREGYQEDQKYQWERTRFEAYIVYRMQNASDKVVSIEEFFPLSNDDTKKQDPEKAAGVKVYTKQQTEYLHKVLNPHLYDEDGRRR